MSNRDKDMEPTVPMWSDENAKPDIYRVTDNGGRVNTKLQVHAYG